MLNFKRLLVIALCVLLYTPVALAQERQREEPAGAAVSQDVIIIIQQQQVRFTSQKQAQEMQLQIFDPAGELVYDSGVIAGLELNWPLQNANGEAIRSGLYAYTLSIKETGAEKRACGAAISSLTARLTAKAPQTSSGSRARTTTASELI